MEGLVTEEFRVRPVVLDFEVSRADQAHRVTLDLLVIRALQAPLVK